MAKRYLSLDEAAEKLGIPKDTLNRYRERGEIRGFADRGTFKFKEEDVEELGRKISASSDAGLQLLDGEDDASVFDDDSGSPSDGTEPSIIRRLSSSPSDSSIAAPGSLFDDMPMGASDSDVRLVLDDDLNAPAAGGGSGVLSGLSDSDSDVRLDDSAVPLLDDDDSDSDVHLSVEESGVNLGSRSDSDVQLIPSDSDSDVRLLDDARLAGPKSGKLKKDSDSDVALIPNSGNVGDDASVLLDDDDLALTGGSGISLTGESGVALGSQSGIALDKVADSGVSLEKDDDSGIALFQENDDDGITLAEDSGIALALDGGGSDISLEDDGGLTLADVSADSGIALADDDEDELELTATLPAMKAAPQKDDDLGDTMLEVPSLDSGEESDFEIGTADGGSQGDTSVLLFDEEEEPAPVAAKGKKKAAADDEEEADETFEFSDEDEVEASADDEEGESEDVFAGDEAFGEDDGEFADSEGDYAAAPARGAVAAGPVEYPWGAGLVATLSISSVCMLFCAMAAIDLVRSIWQWQALSPANSWLIETLGGLFK